MRNFIYIRAKREFRKMGPLVALVITCQWKVLASVHNFIAQYRYARWIANWVRKVIYASSSRWSGDIFWDIFRDTSELSFGRVLDRFIYWFARDADAINGNGSVGMVGNVILFKLINIIRCRGKLNTANNSSLVVKFLRLNGKETNNCDIKNRDAKKLCTRL